MQELTRTQILHVGRWRVDAEARVITNGSVEARLSPRAVRLLLILSDAPGEVVPRTTLIDAIWPNVTVSDESLTQAVAELRRAFARDGEAEPSIETIARSGYRLQLPVLREVDESSHLSATPDYFDLTAYRLCLESRQALARSGPGALELAEALSREAAERAPKFAMAQAEFAIMLAQRHLYRTDGNDRLAEALRRAEQAVRLRPDLSTAHASMAMVLGALEQWHAAERSIGKALSCDPNDPDAHYLAARTQFAAADYRTAAVLGERAGQLNPDDYRALFLAARAAREFDEARGLRNAEAALQRVQIRLSRDPSEPRALNALGPLLAQLGQYEQAVAAFEADESRGSPVEFYNAVARAYVGDVSGAIGSLEIVADRGWNHPAWLRSEPVIARLAGERRFKRLGRALAAG